MPEAATALELEHPTEEKDPVVEISSLKDAQKYESNSVKELKVIHKMEYIPGNKRYRFMEELYRILEPGARATIVVCYWSSPRAIQDPAVEWPPICEQSFLYFNKGWRELNQLDAIKCDFDFTYGYNVDQEVSTRSQESQTFWVKHYLNTANDLQIVLTKRN
jgi:hypothetical protein